MLGVQDRGARGLHRRVDGAGQVHVQADLQRRGGAPVPRADLHPPPLGSPPVAEGQVPTVWQGQSAGQWVTTVETNLV